MNIITVENQELGAQRVQELMKKKLDAGKLDVLGLATGSTMIPIYEKWIESDLSFENVTSFNLDEYIGLNPENKNSYYFFMDEHSFSKKKF